jgi:tetratricopeptide (TPR) repeat protein
MNEPNLDERLAAALAGETPIPAETFPPEAYARLRRSQRALAAVRAAKPLPATAVLNVLALEAELRRLAGLSAALSDYATTLGAKPHLPTQTLALTRSLAPELPIPAGYEPLGELGRGGMAVVLLARQAGVDRLVALKMLHTTNPQLNGRLRDEAAALGRLQHPNVVQIHEIGSVGERLFLAMEYVAGGGLDRALKGKTVPVRTAAALVLPMARALHAAHAAGVVHRDLKPANVLLHFPTDSTDLADAVPKVADFGLAKVQDSPALNTASGFIVGTPGYLAPEQALGQPIQPSVDIHALGLVLYELLTGRQPFVATTAAEALYRVVKEEPTSVRLQSPWVPRDLEAVCMKCLEKDPRRRYATAADLAADLERFLADRPTHARPLGAVGRAWRWCRRNPWVATLTTTTMLALIGGIAFSLNYAAAATFHAHRATQNAHRAQTSEREARSAVQLFLQRLSEHPDLQAGGHEELRRDLQRYAVDYLERFLAQEHADPALRQEVITASLRLAVLLLDQEQTDRANELTHRVDALVEPDDDPSWLPRARFIRADAAMLGGRLADAQVAYQHTLELARQRSLRTLEAAVLKSLGVCYQKQQHNREAEKCWVEAREILRADVQAQPTDRSKRFQLAEVLSHLGRLAVETGRVPAAETYFRAALDEAKVVVGGRLDLPDHQNELALRHSDLGKLLLETNRLADAEPHLREAVAIHSRLGQTHARVPKYRANWADNANMLGQLLFATNRLSDAEAEFRRAWELRSALAAAAPPGALDPLIELAGSHQALGMLLSRQGHSDAAKTEYQHGVTLCTRVMDRDRLRTRVSAQRGSLLVNLAVLEQRAGQFATVNALLTQALADFDRALELEPNYEYAKLRRYHAYEGRSRARMKLQQYREAADDLAVLTAAAGNDLTYAIRQMQMLTLANDPTTAVRVAQTALDAHAPPAPICIQIARALLSNGPEPACVNQARRVLRQAVQTGATETQLRSDPLLAPLLAHPDWRVWWPRELLPAPRPE